MAGSITGEVERANRPIIPRLSDDHPATHVSVADTRAESGGAIDWSAGGASIGGEQTDAYSDEDGPGMGQPCPVPTTTLVSPAPDGHRLSAENRSVRAKDPHR